MFILQVLLTPPDEGPRVKGQRIKLQDIIDGEYAPQKLNGSWIGRKFLIYYLPTASQQKPIVCLFALNLCGFRIFFLLFTTIFRFLDLF